MYTWSDVEQEQAKELGCTLIGNNIQNYYPLSAEQHLLVKQILSLPANKSTLIKGNKKFWQKKQLKISLELFEPLESSMDLAQTDHFLREFEHEISNYLYEGYSIGINFREVFLVQEGMSPPAHYRPGVDICVKTVSEYKKQTERFSYQLAKVILYAFSPLIELDSTLKTPLNEKVLYQYTGFSKLTNWCGSSLSSNFLLKEIPYFSSMVFGSYFHNSRYRYSKSTSVIAFTDPVCVDDLSLLFMKLAKSSFKELTIILKGKCYDNEATRQITYEKLIKIIQETKCCIKINFFLITNSDIETPLLSLAAVQNEQDGLFQPLLHNAGFYLPAKHIDPSIYHNIHNAGITYEQWASSFYLLNDVGIEQVTLKLGSYIKNEEASKTTRKSKKATKEQLKAKVQLAVNQSVAQQESATQTQIVQEQVQETLTQNVNKQSSIGQKQSYSNSGWISSFNIETFCDELQKKARYRLASLNEDEALEQVHFFTKNYLERHSRRRFYESLINDKKARLHFASKLFGYVPYKSKINDEELSFIKLPHYSVDKVATYLVNQIFYEIESSTDGYPESKRTIKKQMFSGLVLDSLGFYNFGASQFNAPRYFSKISQLSQLGGEKDKKSTVFQGSPPCAVLLYEQELSTLEPPKQDALRQNAQSLLSLFSTHPLLSSEEISVYEQKLVELIHFYFPDRQEDITRLNAFIATFEQPNEDNLRIILLVLIQKHKNGADIFLNLLSLLERRGLLRVFYLIHFKYALTVSSLDPLIDDPLCSVFLNLIAQIPDHQVPEEWPPFITFSLNLLLSLTKNGALPAQLFNFTKKSLEYFWRRLTSKFIAYCGSVAEAEILLEAMVNKLISIEGLAIGQISQFETFLIGLENVLDNAMEKNSLREQLEELRTISFLPMDASYALAHNQYYVISSEMRISSSEIDPKTQGYAVSTTGLQEAINQHHSGSEILKRDTFRYLGRLSLRRDLRFYRQLHQQITQNHEQDFIDVSELVWAYFIEKTTGDNYQAEVNEVLFTQELTAFLKQHSFAKDIPQDFILACLNSFFTQLRAIPIQEQNGMYSLWRIWREHKVSAFGLSKAPIPEIFLKRFDAKGLGHFLLSEKSSLEKALPSLNTAPEVAYVVLSQWMNELNIDAHYKKIMEHDLRLFYGPLTMKSLVQNTKTIQRFLHSMSALFAHYPQSLMYLSLTHIFEEQKNVDASVSLIELIAKVVEHNPEHREKEQQMVQWALVLQKHPNLYCNLPKLQALLTLLFEHVLKTKTAEKLDYLFLLSEKILALEQQDAINTLPTLLDIVSTVDGQEFIKRYPDLSATQLKGLAQFSKIVNHVFLMIKVVEKLLAIDSDCDFTALNTELENLDEEQIYYLLKLTLILCKNPSLDCVTLIKEHKNTPLSTLKKLIHLHEVHKKSSYVLLPLLSSHSLDADIAQIKRQMYSMNLERYEYDLEDIQEKISQIRTKAIDSDADSPLGAKEQNQLLQDYQKVMSFMTTNPIRFKIAGVSHECTINELDEQQFKVLFALIQNKIKQGIDVHQHQLLLIALSAEALYRNTHTFPRSTQLLTVLHHLNYPGNIIHEVKTGEGKSIITAMHAVMLCAAGHTVDVATENEQLAKQALNKFNLFYDYLGIPHSSSVLHAQSEYQDYVANGINYSTASNLALFRARMAIDGHALPANPALVADEIDATLTTTVQYRLAACLNPELRDTKFWEQVYLHILNFVKEKEIFVANACSAEADVQNLRNYFIAQKSKKEYLDFTQKISDTLLGTLIESALVAHELEQQVDYYVVDKEIENQKYSYAAPIITSTNRPDPNVSYSEYVQQLLHTLLNNKKQKPRHPFIIEPSTETLMAISAKNFFDYYRHKKGPIVGLTGTAGSHVERKEFYDLQGLTAFSYPTFHPDLSADLGLVAAFGHKEHLQAIEEWLKGHKEKHPSQPILLITPSPQFTEQLHQYLAKRHQWNIQSYHGYEDSGKKEEFIILTAGQDSSNTIANQSLARGADITPEYEHGLLVLNACVDLTASELRQIQGRAARNGKPGQYLSIINAETIALPENSLDEIALAFKTHQYQISLERQAERLKMHPLEDSRNLIINNYLLQLRQEADKVFKAQFGSSCSIVDNNEFLHALSTLNRKAEKHYADLLEQQTPLSEEETEDFLSARIANYQQVLDQWFSRANDMTQSEFSEPSIPLEAFNKLKPALQAATLGELRDFADLFHLKWLEHGNHKAIQFFEASEEILTHFEPYFQKKSSFKETLGQLLEKKNLLHAGQLETSVTEIENNINELVDYAKSIPILGSLIPEKRVKNFFLDYLKTTKQAIREKKWDAIKLPEIDLRWITQWIEGISSALTVGSFMLAGPIPFLVKSLIIPSLISWITGKLKKQFVKSESAVLQILSGIADLGDDLQKAIPALLALSKEKKITVGMLLDQFGPITRNKALVSVLIKYLELTHRQEYIPYIKLLPEFSGMLEPYRKCTLDELLHVETLLNCLKYMAQSKFLQDSLANSHYKPSLLRLAQLNTSFFERLSELNAKELLKLINTIAHPEFFNLLSELPPEITVFKLYQYLEKIPEDAPLKIKEALKNFLDYQNNHELIGEKNRLRLLGLREQYHLTLDKLKLDLDGLKPKHPIRTIEEEGSAPLFKATEQPSTSVSKWRGYVNAKTILMGLSLTALLVYNVLFFSVPILLVSLALIAWLSYPHIKKQITDWYESRTTKEVEIDAGDQELQADNTIQFSVSNPAELIATKPKLQEPMIIKKDSWSCGFFPCLKLAVDEPQESIAQLSHTASI